MVLWDSLLMAFRALIANKLRAALTMLGVIIGVSAVIALVSLGQGVQAFVTRRMQSIGSNLLFVVPGSLSEFGGGGAASLLGAERAVLTMADVYALQGQAAAPHVAAVSPEIQTVAEITSGVESKRATIVGVWPNFLQVRQFRVAYGRFIAEGDESARAAVCVLGPRIARELFGDSYPIGKRVRIKGVPFQVVGVLERKGGSAFADVDSYVYVPLSTAQTRLYTLRGRRGEPGVSAIYVQATSEADMDRAAEEVRTVIRRVHRLRLGEKDDFSVISQADITAIFSEITSVLTAFLGAIAGISLLVGGIGIMNIMLVSVTERTREIGIRKAVGARRRDILLQFLVEAVTLSLTGGVVGVVLGALTANQASVFLQGVRPVLTAQTVLLAAGVASAVGIFFGLYPARRAASLNPIDALRYE
jgi:putative ABC transport system permease protein